MRRVLVGLCGLLCCARAAIAQEPGAGGRSAAPPMDRNGYTAALVVERTTGQVLFEDNADTPVPTASMVKMMTALLVMEEIAAGRLALDTPVPISARASTMGGSQIFAMEGQSFPVRTLLAATMIQSANDAAVALAEKVAGSVEAFAARMNQRGRALGLARSTFYDPHGLPDRGGRNNVMSAHDLATVGMELLQHPLIREYARMPTMPFANGTFTSGLTSSNQLLRDYPGAFGIKTGFTAEAGFSVTAAARRDGMDLIAVVAGARESRGPMSSFGIAARMFDSAFAAYTFVALVRGGAVVGEVEVERGDPRTVRAVAASAAGAVLPRGEERRVRTTLVSAEPRAPVAAGERVGTLVVQVGGREIARVPALAEAASAVRPWWRFWPIRRRAASTALRSLRADR